MKQFKILILTLFLGFVSCETEELVDTVVQDANNANAQVVSAVNLEVEIDEVEAIFDDISFYVPLNDFTAGKTALQHLSKESSDDEEDEKRFGRFGKCSDFEFERAEDSIVFVMTFTGECEDRDGNPITGTITSTITFSEDSFEITTVTENLAINGYLINGTRSMTRTRSNENGNPEISSSINMTFESAEGTITKAGERRVELTEGGNTATREDNVRTITGFYEYTTPNRNFSMAITTPLVKPASCDFIVSGVKTYTTEEGTSTLDFGDGTCDTIATLTLPDGSQEEIILRRRGDFDTDSDEDDSDEDDSEDDEDDDSDDSEDDDDEMSSGQCVLTTACEEVIFENTSDLSVTSIEENGVFIITVSTSEGEVVYNAECDLGSEVTLECSANNDAENHEDEEDDEYEDEDEEEEENDDSDDDNMNDDEEEENEDSFEGCILTTACGEVRFENMSELTASSTSSNGVFIIRVTNSEGEVIYEEECESSDVDLECS